jgi:hypothetical protein
MKIFYWILGLVFGVPILFFITMFGASELGGEVVTLERLEADGGTSQIRVWIVDQDGVSWIEHGDPDSYWINQLQTSTSVTLTRDGQVITYSATPDPDSHDLYHQLRRQKYGWADKLIGAMGGGDKNCKSMPVQLRTPEEV